MICASRRIPTSSPFRQLGVIALWVAIVSFGYWLLLQGMAVPDVGMAVVYSYFWILAIIPSSLLGYFLSRHFDE